MSLVVVNGRVIRRDTIRIFLDLLTYFYSVKTTNFHCVVNYSPHLIILLFWIILLCWWSFLLNINRLSGEIWTANFRVTLLATELIPNRCDNKTPCPSRDCYVNLIIDGFPNQRLRHGRVNADPV